MLSKFQRGFRKEYIIQDCLLAMVENCKKALDQGNEYGALLTDLSKAFDCLPHDLIVAKLHTYGFSIDSLKLINSYLTERKQRVKINDQFSSWLDIVVGVPPESILGLLLFRSFYDNTPKKIQALAIIMYKVVNNIVPTIVSEIFSFSNVNYNLRSGSQFHQLSANTVWNGQETISNLGPKIWNIVPEEMKQKSSLFAFKREIKQWVPDNCPCRICKNYLPNIGFI